MQCNAMWWFYRFLSVCEWMDIDCTVLGTGMYHVCVPVWGRRGVGPATSEMRGKRWSVPYDSLRKSHFLDLCMGGNSVLQTVQSGLVQIRAVH
jgi:hypothetical protein